MSGKKILIVNFVLLIALVVMAEIFCRLLASENKPFDERKDASIIYTPSGYTKKWMNESQNVYAVKDGKILYDKIIYHINKQGFRDGRDFSTQKDTNEIRIAILGGSHVFDLNCYNYEGYFGFPAMLEDSLRAKQVHCRVINAGEPGADSKDFAAKILYSLSKYHPDYIVINSTWNDIKWIREMTDETLINKTQPMAVKKNPLIEPVNSADDILGSSIIYRKLRDYYWKKKLNIGLNNAINEGAISNNRAEYKNFRPGLEQYKLNIAAAIELSRLIGAKPVLAIEERLVSPNNSVKEKKLIQYVVAGVDNHETLCALFNDCDSVLKWLSRKYEVPLINANKEIGGDLRYFRDHVHTTPEGSQMIAKAYCSYFIDSIHIKK